MLADVDRSVRFDSSGLMRRVTCYIMRVTIEKIRVSDVPKG